MKKIILLLLFFPISISALEYPTLHYKNAIVYDITENKTLYEYNSNEEVSIASITKTMTVITAIENIEDYSKEITYTEEMKNNVAWYASVAGYKVGDKLTFEDLLYGAILPSGADATVALAIATSGSLENFIKEMNELALKIGMTNSHFVNVHGLDEDNHYSSAADLQKLLTYALQNETFRKVYTTKEYTSSTGKKLKSTILKANTKYNLDISRIVGSKTGTTELAGLCISVLMEDEGHEILIITLGAPNDGYPYNVADAIELIDFIEKSYNNTPFFYSDKELRNLKVEESKTTEYSIKTGKNIVLYLPSDYNEDDLNIKYEGFTTLSYKNKLNEKIGTIFYYYQNEVIATEKVYLTINLEPDYNKIILNNLNKIVLIIILIIFIIALLIYIKKAIKR